MRVDARGSGDDDCAVDAPPSRKPATIAAWLLLLTGAASIAAGALGHEIPGQDEADELLMTTCMTWSVVPFAAAFAAGTGRKPLAAIFAIAAAGLSACAHGLMLVGALTARSTSGAVPGLLAASAVALLASSVALALVLLALTRGVFKPATPDNPF